MTSVRLRASSVPRRPHEGKTRGGGKGKQRRGVEGRHTTGYTHAASASTKPGTFLGGNSNSRVLGPVCACGSTHCCQQSGQTIPRDQGAAKLGSNRPRLGQGPLRPHGQAVGEGGTWRRGHFGLDGGGRSEGAARCLVLTSRTCSRALGTPRRACAQSRGNRTAQNILEHVEERDDHADGGADAGEGDADHVDDGPAPEMSPPSEPAFQFGPSALF